MDYESQGYNEVPIGRAYSLQNAGGLVFVCTKGADGRYDLAPVAWCCPLDYDPVSMFIAVLDTSHKTWADILAGGVFALAFPGADQKELVERCGSVSGFSVGPDLVLFLLLPVAMGILSRLGSEVLFYRTMFLEEIGKDYVRTARAKGLSEAVVLWRHVLRNALLPILTSTVAVLPLLFLGALIMESFFGIPGLGSFTIDAINAQDFAVVRSMVFLGSALYILGLILTDISYTLADPRVRLG